MKKFFIIFSIFLLTLAIAPSVYASTFKILPDRDPTVENFFIGEQVTAQVTITEANEKGRAWVINISNNTGDVVDILSGTTGTTIPSISSATYVINSSLLGRIEFNITSGTNLLDAGDVTGDFINVSSSNTNALIISNCIKTATEDTLIGKEWGLLCDVDDENGRPVSHAQCAFIFTDEAGVPLTLPDEAVLFTKVGKVAISHLLDPAAFRYEDANYNLRLGCTTGPENTSGSGYDDQGNQIPLSTGSIVIPFSISHHLMVTTNISDVNNNPISGSIKIGDIIGVSANITNPENRTRINTRIRYEYRCGTDDTSGDRIVPEHYWEERGIDGNITQTQTHMFTMLGGRPVETGSTSCYASTHVEVLDKADKLIFTYDTRSIDFIRSIEDIHPSIIFSRINSTYYNASFNLSDYDIENTDVHVIINSLLTDQKSPISRIKSVSSTWANGSTHPYNTALLIHENRLVEDGEPTRSDNHVVYEIEGVNASDNPLFEVIVELESFEERMANATEGINEKTGNFFFSVDAPPKAFPGEPMTFTISASLESGVPFTDTEIECGILENGVGDENTWLNRISFEKRIFEDTPFVTTRAINIPDTNVPGQRFEPGTSHSVLCIIHQFSVGRQGEKTTDSFEIKQKSSEDSFRSIMFRVSPEGVLVPVGIIPQIKVFAQANSLFILLVVLGSLGLIWIVKELKDPMGKILGVKTFIDDIRGFFDTIFVEPFNSISPIPFKIIMYIILIVVFIWIVR